VSSLLLLQALISHLLGYLFDIDIAFGKGLSQLLFEIFLGSKGSRFRSLENLARNKHLVFMLHQPLDIFCSHENEVVVHSINLLLSDCRFSCDRVEKLICLLAGALLLSLISFNERSKLRCPLCHHAIILLLSVVCLGFALKFFNDLVFLAKLKVDLSEFIL